MFRKSSQQMSLDSVEMVIGPSKLSKLQETWAHTFRNELLPLIREDDFAHMYDNHMGAPNKSVKLLVALCLLREVFNLTDRQLIENFEWSSLWQYAVDVPPVEARIDRKTLYNFRNKLIEYDMAEHVFNLVTDGIIERLNINVSLQRTDSTHFISDFKFLHRLGLFVKTIELFLKHLKAQAPSRHARLPKRFFERYIDREGYFADSKGSKAKRDLEKCASDVWYLICCCKDSEQLMSSDAYLKLERLFAEQCNLINDNKEVVLKDPSSKDPEDEIPGSSMQTPYDEDVTYGHKGKGYEAQLTETCSDDNVAQVITDVRVTDSCGNDSSQLNTTLDRLETNNRKPDVILADAGYVNGDALLAAEDKQVDVVGPMSGTKGKSELLHVDDFNLQQDEQIKCPAGHTSIDTIVIKDKKGTIKYVFDRHTCETCPLAASCPVMHSEIQNDKKNPPKQKRKRQDPRLNTDRKRRKSARHRQKEKQQSTKEQYKKRSGIEAMNANLKNHHGLGRIRARGRPKMKLLVTLKAAALNCKRLFTGVVCLKLQPAQG